MAITRERLRVEREPIRGGASPLAMVTGAGVSMGAVSVLTILAGSAASVLRTDAGFRFPFIADLPVERDVVIQYGIWTAVGLFVAMFAGAILGGVLGARWHTKLENAVLDERTVDRPEIRQREHAHADDDVQHTHDEETEARTVRRR